MTTWSLWVREIIENSSRFSESEAERRSDAVRAIAGVLKAEPKLLQDRPAYLPLAVVEQLRRKLRDGAGLREYLLRQKLFLAFLKSLKKCGWKIDVPARELLVRREPSFFGFSSFDSIQIARGLRENFLLSLGGRPSTSPDRLLGTALLSAILFGGLLDERWWAPWLQAAGNLNRSGDYCWLTLRREVRSKVAGREVLVSNEERQWPLDPLTEILLRKWLVATADGDRIVPSLAQALRPCLRSIGMQSVNSLKNRLKDLGRALAFGGVPIQLIHYASGHSPGTSLPETAWWRLLNNRAIQQEPTLPNGGGKSDVTEDPGALGPVRWKGRDKERQEQLYRELLPLISSDSNRERDGRSVVERPSERLEAIEKLVADHESEIAPALGLLVAWACHLLRGQRAGQQYLQPTSVRRYLQTFGAAYLAYVGFDNPLEYDPDDFLECYLELVQRHTEKPRTKREDLFCARALTRFHQYLVHEFEVPRIALHELHASGETGVDANILTLQEFDRLKKALSGGGRAPSRTRRMARLIAVLAFRCGLRRTEIRSLQLRDLQGIARPSLWIRSNSIARKKTPSARRWLQLNSLLTLDEKAELLEWRKFRLTESLNDGEALLFAAEESPKLMLSSSPCFDLVTSLMRQVAGDRSLHFHHLRHSAANWFFLRLGIAGGLVLQVPFFSDHPLLQVDSCERLQAEYLGGQNAGRNLLYATAIFLGHASPSSTLQNYLHFSDWLLADALQKGPLQARLDLNLASSLTDLQPARLYRVAYGERREARYWLPSSLIGSVRRASRSVEVSSCALQRKNLRIELPEEKDAQATHLPWQQIACALDEFAAGHRISVIARRRGLPQAMVAGWIENAQRLCSMRTRGMKGQPGQLRHVWKENPRCAGLLPLPRSRQETEELTRMWNAFHRLPTVEQEQVLANLQLFLERYSHFSPMVSFNSKKQLKGYLAALRKIEVPWEKVHISVFSSGRHGLSAERKECLSRELAVAWEQISELRRAQGSAVRETLAMRIVHLRKDGRFVTSSSFRCFVYLAKIDGGHIII